MNETDLAYSAGFFDGEGSISIYLQERRWHKLHISIGNTDRPVLQAIHALLGGSLWNGSREIPGHRPMYFWGATDCNAKRILELLLPHLHVKRAQAELAIKFQTMKSTHVRYRGGPGGGSNPVSPEEWAARETIRQRIKSLNGVTPRKQQNVL